MTNPVIYVPLSTPTAHGLIDGFDPLTYEQLTDLWNQAAEAISCSWTQYIYAIQSGNYELAQQYATQTSEILNTLAANFNKEWDQYYHIRYFVQNSEGLIRAYGGREEDKGGEIQQRAEVFLPFLSSPTSVTVIRHSTSAHHLTVYLSAPFANIVPGTGSSCVNILRVAINEVNV